MNTSIYGIDENGNAAVRVTTNPATTTDPTSIYGVDENGNAAMRVMGMGGGSDQHNLGWFATPEALEEAYPTATAGDWGIVGSTDTVWIWDTDSEKWVDSDQKGQVTSVNGQTGDVTVDSLPSQTGQNGKFLTTNGTSASWEKGLKNLSSRGGVIVKGIDTGTNDPGANNQVVIVTGEGSNISGYQFARVGSITGVGPTIRKLSGHNAVALGGNVWLDGDGGIAIGGGAEVRAAGAIQISSKSQSSGGYNAATNSDANTFKVANGNGNFEIMSADGTIPEARLADTTNAQEGDVLTLDSDGNAVWQAGSDGLPDQTGQAGKFLTTDGTDASWETPTTITMRTWGANE